MMEGLILAGEGLRAGQRQLDAVANDIANVLSPGFEAERPAFEAFLVDPGRPVAGPAFPSAPRQAALGVRAGTALDPTAGPVQVSGRRLDAAPPGESYFVVGLADGGEAYTRDGTFEVDGAGNLVTPGGEIVLGTKGPLRLPAGASGAMIRADGTVTATVGTASVVVGRLVLADFPNPGGVSALGGGLYAATVASGRPTVKPAAGLAVGALEGSNVNLSREMTDVLLAQRYYQLSAHEVGVYDQMLQMADQLSA